MGLGILINFLNNILEPEGKQIVDLDYLDRKASPKIEGGKGCRFDVRAKAKDGRIFHVEVQIGEDVHFFERCLFYSCDSYVDQLKSGQVYHELMPLIFIGVLWFQQFKGRCRNKRIGGGRDDSRGNRIIRRRDNRDYALNTRTNSITTRT